MLSTLLRLPSLMSAVWHNRNGGSHLPRFLTYIVTFTCNARCIMCDSWRKTSRDDLDLSEISRIFEELPDMDAVRLTGGEPFVRKDLLEIAHLAQDKLRPLFLHVTTNGFLTDRIVRFCEQRDKTVPLRVLVSIDGVGEKHNAVRGRGFAWRRVMETLAALAPRRDELNLDLAVNQTVVDAEGGEHYVELREILRPLGVHNQVVLAYDASATYSAQSEPKVERSGVGTFTTFGLFSRDQLETLFDEIERDVGILGVPERSAKRYYLKGIRNRLLEDLSRPNPKCVALSSHIRLLPDGQVPTCQFNSKTVGSLRNSNFPELWSGEARLRQRRWVVNCPGCWAECEILPNAIYSGDLVAELLRTI